MLRQKIRASALGRIMIGADLAGKTKGLSATDTVTLDSILKKKESGKPLTEKQEIDLPKLISKRDEIVKPCLSEGAKTYVQDKWYGEVYEYQKNFTNKYTQKGKSSVEDRSIEQTGRLLGYNFAVKNLEWKENDYTHGTPDWLVKQFVFDQKNVWEPKGLNFFDSKLQEIYEWQVKAYCWLFEKSEGAVIRTLMNPSEAQIRQEARAWWIEASNENSWNDVIPESFIDEVRDVFDFEGKKPIEDRINILPVSFTEEDRKLIIQQVDLMNEYWIELNSLNESKNIQEIQFFRNKN